MNSVERILAAVDFKQVDRIPVIAQVFAHAATYGDVPLDQYLRDGQTLAECQIKAHQQHGYDATFALMDLFVETEALGTQLTYFKSKYPQVKHYVLNNISDIKRLKYPDPKKDGRMPELLKAAGILRENSGNETLVVGTVAGPMTLVTQLLGIEAALYMAVDETDSFLRLLDFSTEVAIRFGIAQLEAGVHLPVVFDPSSSPEVIPPQFYREFIVPRLKRLFSLLKEAGAVCNWLHTTGNTEQILQYYPEMGVELANIDYVVDMQKAMEQLPETCIDGNLTPLSFLMEPEKRIEDKTLALLNQCSNRRGFILSSGCEIPYEANPGNITAMIRSVREAG